MELKDIPDRLRRMGRSQADLARHLELDPASLSKTIRGARNVQAREVRAMEAFFGEELVIEPASIRLITPRRAAPPAKVPVYGYAAAGGDDRIAIAENDVLEWREPPPYWNGSGDLFYVRVQGDSMAPRYFGGEIVPVRRKVEPGRDDDCIIELVNGTALLKTFVRKDGLAIRVRQYNPAQDLPDIPRSDVRALHTVWRPR